MEGTINMIEKINKKRRIELKWPYRLRSIKNYIGVIHKNKVLDLKYL